jgi:hypothetical protein
MKRASVPGSLFRTSFLEKGLVTFAECVEHYETLDADALLDETRLLMTAPMLAVPFGVSSARYYALMDALIRCAGLNPALSDTQRMKLVGICIDIGVFLRGRTAEGREDAFDVALRAALDAVRGAAAHFAVADDIRQGIRPDRPEPVAEPDLLNAAAEMRALVFDEPPAALEHAIPA